jgi:hypothetical protein
VQVDFVEGTERAGEPAGGISTMRPWNTIDLLHYGVSGR